MESKAISLLQPIFDLSPFMLKFKCETSYWNPTSKNVHKCILIFMATNRLGWGVYHHYELTLVDINHYTNSRK